MVDFTWNGSYSVNSDGTGEILLRPTAFDSSCTPVQPPNMCKTFEELDESYAFSYGRLGGRMFLTKTDYTTTGAKVFLVGQAFRQ
jgi:hypothetical protein